MSIVGNTITNTTAGTDALFNGDGINLIRRDSSLLLAEVLHNTLTGNASNGLEVDTQGTNKDNQNQPMVGTVNSVTWTNNILNNNGENGASFATRGDSQLVANGMANVATGNTLSGILVSTSEASSFGDPSLAVGDPMRRSIFSGITSSNNGLDGIGLFSSETSQLLVEIRSDRIATTSGAHAALNTMGDTAISNNARDGVHIESTDSSAPDILITAETPVTPTSARTVISGNGTNDTVTIPAGTDTPTAIQMPLLADLTINLGGSGVLWDSFDSAGGMVQIYNTDIVNNLAGDTEDVNGDGILTFQEDQFGNWMQNQYILGSPGTADDLIALAAPTDQQSVYTEGNLDIDVLGGDGVEFNYFQSSTSTLIVGDAGMGNRIQGNQDDGIALTGDVREIFLNVDAIGNNIRTTDGPEGGVTSPTIRITDNQIGGERDGLPAGNLGDGVSVRSFGFAAAGVLPADVDAALDDGDGLFPFNGGGAADRFFSGGPIPDILLTGNMISRNGRSGVNIRLQGGAGANSLRTVPVTLDPVASASVADYNRIAIVDNTIVSNGEHGVFFRGDSDMNQNRILFTPNLDDGMGNFNVNTFDPAGQVAQAAIQGFGAGDVVATFPFLNLATVQNSLFTVTGNTIQSNGTNTVVGHGVEIRVGTGAYVAADIRDNIFGGNLEEDLFTGAFYSAMDFADTPDNNLSGWREDVFDSIDNDGEFVRDVVYLDDAALLDIRFTGNSGDQINPQEDNAFQASAIPFIGARPNNSIAVDISAFYFDINNTDPIKGFRDGSIFKIDNFNNLNAPNNNFVNLGVPQLIGGAGGAFSTYTRQNATEESPWPANPFE